MISTSGDGSLRWGKFGCGTLDNLDIGHGRWRLARGALHEQVVPLVVVDRWCRRHG
jgi:hypothetical protein